MSKKKLTISHEELIRLYTKEHLTGQEIADRYGVSRQSVHFRLRYLGIHAVEGGRVTLFCEFCGKKYWCHRKKFKTEGSSYCSQNCYFLKRSNPSYKQWRHGQRLARAIVSLHYPLRPKHVVHHKDDNNYNNDIANLAVFANQSDHLAYHHDKRKVLPRPVWDGATI